jgi:putative transposase
VTFLSDNGHAVPCEPGKARSRRPRRNHTPAFKAKAKVALAAVKGEMMLAQLAEHFGRPSEPDHPVEGPTSGRGCRCFRSWRRRRSVAAGCRREVVARKDRRADARKQLFKRSAQQSRAAERKAMIDRAHDLPITKQAKALNISRGSVYYLPRPVPAADLAIMRHVDRLHLEFPFAGSRMLRGLLAAEKCKIGRLHVKTLMRRMGIEALYRRSRTTRLEPGEPDLSRVVPRSRSQASLDVRAYIRPRIWRQHQSTDIHPGKR